MRSLLIVLAIAVAFAASESVTRYDGFKVFRLTPETKQQVQLLTLLQNFNSGLDFWDGVGGPGKTTDVMVSSERLNDFIMMMERNGITMEVFVDDVQKNIDLAGTPISYNKGQKAPINWTEYYRLDGIYDWLNDLVIANPLIASTIDLGLSYEGRQIKALKLTFGPGRRAVYVEGGIHAREWISPATTTYLINELLNSQDAAIRALAQSYDWYIVPVANPDGYEFTYTQTRLWRKTRTPYPLCSGADMNRNWDVFWGTEGTSTLTCSETYGGPNAFSEKETVVLSEFIKTIGSQLDVFISFHSYGQKMLMPYGHTLEHLDNYDDVYKIGQAAIKALAVRYNTQYEVGNTAETVYKHSGGTMDWVKKTFQVPIAFTYELRDTGRNGFVLPPSEIIPNCLEVIDSIVALFNEGKNLGLTTPA